MVVSTYTIIKIQQKDRSSSISRNKEAKSHTLSRWWNTITTKQSNMKINQQQMESRRCGSKPIYCYYRKKKKMGRKNTEKLGKQENETSKQQRKNSSESLCSKYTIYTDWQLIISNGERQQLNYQITVIDTNNKAAKIGNECCRAAEKAQPKSNMEMPTLHVRCQSATLKNEQTINFLSSIRQ